MGTLLDEAWRLCPVGASTSIAAEGDDQRAFDRFALEALDAAEMQAAGLIRVVRVRHEEVTGRRYLQSLEFTRLH